MNKTYHYLLDRYNSTLWPYYGLNQTRFDIGSTFDKDIKELRNKDLIEPCAGLNGWLIKMINLDLWVFPQSE